MRGLTLTLVCCGLFWPLSVANAQSRERVKVTNIRMGLQAGPNSSGKQIYKPGQWAPVFVDLECTKDTEEKLLLTVETTDTDGIISEATVEITAMQKGEAFSGAQLGPLPYLKPGTSYATVAARVKGAESKRTLGESGNRNINGIEAGPLVLASVGFNVGALRLRTGDDREDDPNSRELRGGWVETAQILSVEQMPDQWFGYAAVDVLIFGSGGDRTFWEQLSARQNASRRRALVEWVRRGGRLILSVGNNVDVLEAFKELRDVLPVTIPADAKQSSKSLMMRWNTIGQVPDALTNLGYRDGAGEFAWVKLIPRLGSATFPLVQQVDERGKELTPVVVQSAYGSGRITVVGFDLDRSPFADWRNRASFWENLINQAGHELPAIGAKYQRYGGNREDYSGAMQGNLDFFEGVPIVSFGWVALFILIYIVLIGPVDYLFLKKVVKRLEWTWVTFPIMVILVSAGAYFAAYAIKGNDLKMNKIDVVDIDLTGNRLEGHTYFTLFSPRIDDYSIAVEPAGDDGDPTSSRWSTMKSHDASYNSLVSWFGRVKDTYYSSGQSGFFSKRFQYQVVNHPNEPDRQLFAAGVERVPIQVWTTKTLAADWTIGYDVNKPPITANLSVGQDPNTLVGTITNQLPTQEFSDVGLMWRGKIYELKDFTQGVTYNITLSASGEGGNKSTVDIKTWLNDHASRYKGATFTVPKQATNNYMNAGTPSDPNFRLWPVLFYDASVENNRPKDEAPNAAVRALDQSWRVRAHRTEQAILVLRTPTKEDQAEAMVKSSLSPSRLWIGKLPTASDKRAPLQGTLRQETYVRVFIPVKTSSR